MQFSLVRSEKDGLLEFRDGIVGFVLQTESASERLMSLPLLGSELHGDAKLGNRFVKAAFGLKRLREVRMSYW